MLFREQKLPWKRCRRAGRCGWDQPHPCQTGRGRSLPTASTRALADGIDPEIPSPQIGQQTPRVGGNGELVFTPRALGSTPAMVRCATELQTRQALRTPTKRGGCLSKGELQI